jgi:hypothetical protein
MSIMRCRTSKRLTPGEAGIDLMPPRHVIFACAPAEVDDATLAVAGKVEQAVVDALELDAKSVDLPKPRIQLFDQRLRATATFVQALGVLDVSVALRPLRGLRQRLAEAVELLLASPHRRQLVAQAWEQRFRFSEGEELHGLTATAGWPAGIWVQESTLLSFMPATPTLR